MRDVLDRDPRARQQRDETVPQLSRGPFLRVEPGVLGYLAERTPNVGRVERGAALRREDKIIVRNCSVLVGCGAVPSCGTASLQ